MENMINTLASTLAKKIEKPEHQRSILNSLRLRLVELCQQKDNWLANGRCYLTQEGDTWLCKDSKTGKDMTILWGGKELKLKHVENDTRDKAKVLFKLVDTEGESSDIFRRVLLQKTDFSSMIKTLSEGSVQLLKIELKNRFKNFDIKGEFGPENQIVLGERKTKEDDLLYPQALTIETKNGNKFSYFEEDENTSFEGMEAGDRWYPDFSEIKRSNIIARHERQYIEADCYNKGKNGSRKWLLSREKDEGNFTPHYLFCGNKRIAVLHLVGKKEAEIKFGKANYTVSLRERDGALITKNDCFFQVSRPRTFWINIETGKKFDHEPD